MTEFDLIVDEKFAADDEEQDHADDNVGEGCSDGQIFRTLSQEGNKRRGSYHGQRIEFGEPRNHDGREAKAADRRL